MDLKTDNLGPIQQARQRFTSWSLRKAAQRIAKEKQIYWKYQAIEFQDRYDQEVSQLAKYGIVFTQYGDTSSVTRGRFSPNGMFYGTVGSSGQGKIWSSDNFSKNMTNLIGADSKLNDICFHPRVGQIPSHAPNILTVSERHIQMWTFNSSLTTQKHINIEAHTARINRVRFDHSGNYFFTCSYDNTWALWDATRPKNIFRQKGHTSEIHSLSLHPDNSLIFTGDLQGNGMIWDLRTGKGVCEYSDKDSILCSDFNKDGHYFAFGGKTNIISIFDLRSKKVIKSIPAHIKLISDLKYSDQGKTLASVSHDNTIKIWHGLNYSLVNKEMSQLSKITSVDISKQNLATTMIDRKWALWQIENKSNKIQSS